MSRMPGWRAMFLNLGAALARRPAERTAALPDPKRAPMARSCHAEEDHLIPLHAAPGAAEGEPAAVVWHDAGRFGGITATSRRVGCGPGAVGWASPCGACPPYPRARSWRVSPAGRG